MEIKIHTFDLRLKHTFRISRETRNVQKTLIIELIEDGISGYGEATATKFYGVTIAEMVQIVETIQPLVRQYQLDHPSNLWSYLRPHLSQHPFIMCAIDNAAYDLWGKKMGQPVYRLMNLQTKFIPLTNYTIGIDNIDTMIEKIKEQPWPIYKIKLGTPNDIEIIETLRKHTDAIFRVDANCAWSVEQTICYSKIMKKLKVEFIEQPMNPDQLEAMEVVYQKSHLPLIADESCRAVNDVARCHQRFHGINIKLTKCGGLSPALRMIQHARKLKMKVMVGCMTESTIGIAAVAHLLPMLDYVDMDGPLLISNNPAKGIDINNGYVQIPDKPGLGATLRQF